MTHENSSIEVGRPLVLGGVKEYLISEILRPKSSSPSCRHGSPGVEASIWKQRTVSALVNSVEGGKWFSLWIKSRRPLEVNKCAAGVGGRAWNGLAANAEAYLAELGRD